MPGTIMTNTTTEGTTIVCGQIDKWQQALMQGGPQVQLWMIPIVPTMPQVTCYVNGTGENIRIVRPAVTETEYSGVLVDTDTSYYYTTENDNISVNGTNMTVGALYADRLNTWTTIYYNSSYQYYFSGTQGGIIDAAEEYFFTGIGNILGPVTMAYANNNVYEQMTMNDSSQYIQSMNNMMTNNRSFVMTYTNYIDQVYNEPVAENMNETYTGVIYCTNILAASSTGWTTAIASTCYTVLEHQFPINGYNSSLIHEVENAVLNTETNQLINLDSVYVKPAFQTSHNEYLVAIRQRYGIEMGEPLLNESVLETVGDVYDITTNVIIVSAIYAIIIICEILKTSNELCEQKGCG